MALSSKLRREVLAVFYRYFSEAMVEQGFLEYQAVADALRDSEHVSTRTLKSAIIAARSPEEPYSQTPFDFTSRS